MYKSPLEMLYNNSNSFPFFNVYTTDNTTSVIEVAVAGFDKTELEIKELGEYIHIAGAKQTNRDDKCFLVKGISAKSFSKKFFVGLRKVKSVKLANGILSLTLEEVTPAEGKSIKIED